MNLPEVPSALFPARYFREEGALGQGHELSWCNRSIFAKTRRNVIAISYLITANKVFALFLCPEGYAIEIGLSSEEPQPQ